jgi:DNA-binding transcriptional ArsR family regulator
LDRQVLLAKYFTGFADPIRLAILECLLDGEKSVEEIRQHLGCKQPRISNHLACLRWCNFVQTRREGKRVFYSITDPAVREILRLGQQALSGNAERVYSCTRMRI